MTSLVFFGAGASKPFCIPTMQDMVVEFENRLKNEDKECFEFYSKIKEMLVEQYGKSHVDIESIFSVLDGIISQTKAKDLGYYAFYYIKSINNSHPEGRPIDEHIERANKTENLLKKYLRKSCEVKLLDSDNDKVYEKSYRPFFSNIKGEKQEYPHNKLVRDWKAYTTNYDNLFEGFWNAFEPANTHFEKEPNSNNYVFSPNGLDIHSFCKLHGSLDWTRETKTRRVIWKNTSGYNIYNTEGEVMLFPIQQKDLYLHPWFALFSDLRQGLQTKSIWYVVGYAFNDEFIRNVFQEILVSAPDKKLVLVNPDAENIVYKFSENIRNKIDILPIEFGTEFFDLQFTDYVSSAKTITIRICTGSTVIGIKSNKIISECIIINLSEIDGAVKTNSEPKTSYFIKLDKPTNKEIKIQLKIPYVFGDNIELSLSDGTEKLNFGIDYGDFVIANSNDIRGYEAIEGVLWMKDPIILDKSKLYYPQIVPKVIK